MPRLIRAPAKMNLSLRVLGKRGDGYHEVETRMCRLSLADELEFDLAAGGGVRLVCDTDAVPAGEENLVLKAVRAFEARTGKSVGGTIHLRKRIPSGAGLGGGSSDAAATLLAVNEALRGGLSVRELAGVAAAVGSDVPFFVYESVCDCRGRGEEVEPVAFDWELPLVLVKPDFGIPTAWAYSRWEAAKEVPGVRYAPQVCYWGAMVNDLERPVYDKYLVLAQMKMWLLEQEEAHAAMMTGSGSTMAVVLSAEHCGPALVAKVKSQYGEAIWTHVGYTLPSGRADGWL